MPRKLLASTAVALVVGCLGLVAADVIAAKIEGSAVVRALARNHVAVAAVEIEPLSGKVVARGLTFVAQGARVEIGALRLPVRRYGLALITPAFAESSGDFGASSPTPDASSPPPPGESPPPPPAADAGPAASTATADDVTITRGQATIRIKHIEMAGSSLSSKDLAALLDAGTAESLESRLRKVSATAIVIPEIVSDDATPGSERHTTTRQVLLANVTAGKASAASAAETAFSFKSGDATVVGTIGSMEGANVDLAQMAHVFGTVRTDDNEPILPLYDKVVVNAIKVTNETRKGSFTIGAITETGVRARAFKTDLASAGATATSSPSSAQSAALFDDLAHSMVIGGLDIDDIAFRDDGASAGPNRLEIAHAAMQGFADRRIGGLSLRGFRGEDREASIGIGTVEVAAFVVPPSGAAVADASKAMTPPGKVEIGQIDVDMASRDNGGERIKYHVGRIGFAGEGAPDQIPTKASFAIDNVSMDIPPQATGGLEGFTALGYRHVDLSSAIVANYDAASQDLKIDRFTLNGVGMGSASLGLHLVNVTRGLLSSNPQVQQASAIAILAKGLDLEVKNGGLFEKMIALRAQHDGMTVAQERDIGMDFFANKLPASVNDQPGAKAIGAAIAKFIADPRTLHIAIESRSGLGIGAMGMLSDPNVLLDTLEVRASAND